MISEMTLTYQTRPRLDERQEMVLHECACLLSSVERSLYAQEAKGNTTASCKNEFLKIFGITARQFNSCRVSLEGKISSCKESQSQTIANLKQQLNSLDK